MFLMGKQLNNRPVCIFWESVYKYIYIYVYNYILDFRKSIDGFKAKIEANIFIYILK